MFLQIITRTPAWVFVLFLVLLALGLSQWRERSASRTRITVLPVVMLFLAISGVVSAFGHSSAGLLALAVWAKGAVVAALWVLSRPEDGSATYEPSTQQFHLRGSALPLVLIMGIFFTKYAVGVSLGMHPELAQQFSFALGVSGLYGVFSGIFAGRALRLWRLTQQPTAQALIA